MRFLDRDDAFDLGNLAAKLGFDAEREGRRRHRATAAGAKHVQVHEALVIEVDKLDIPAIGMEGRADSFEDILDAGQHFRRHATFLR